MWKIWISDYYKKGYYTNDQMKVFVTAGWITIDDYKEITGKDYAVAI
ncbi:MAG: XkdX family protein [Sporolactobacillus sp.]